MMNVKIKYNLGKISYFIRNKIIRILQKVFEYALKISFIKSHRH